MSLHKLITNYTDYNSWANNRITEWLNSLNSDLLYQKTPSSYDTITATIKHMYQAQNFWLDFISEKDINTFSWRLDETDVAVIFEMLHNKTQEMQVQFKQFSDTDLIKILSLQTRWAKNSLCRYEYILHVINHSTYHRGQIITMARCLGITEGILNTDYNMFLSSKPEANL
jgi:uncharacterized damage-inducible protein DinB